MTKEWEFCYTPTFCYTTVRALSYYLLIFCYVGLIIFVMAISRTDVIRIKFIRGFLFSKVSSQLKAGFYNYFSLLCRSLRAYLWLLS